MCYQGRDSPQASLPPGALYIPVPLRPLWSKKSTLQVRRHGRSTIYSINNITRRGDWGKKGKGKDLPPVPQPDRHASPIILTRMQRLVPPERRRAYSREETRMVKVTVLFYGVDGDLEDHQNGE